MPSKMYNSKQGRNRVAKLFSHCESTRGDDVYPPLEKSPRGGVNRWYS